MHRNPNPRTTLHALPPIGTGTPEVESLTSYVARLAHSHSMTAQKLTDWVLDHFGEEVCAKYAWHQRSLSGASDQSELWASRLAELTGVENLDRLTLSPWRHLVGTPGLAPKSDRWCPCCLEEDREEGREPYLRLAWDVAPVTACSKHRVELVSTCPHCERSNVRNRASIVVPGYCTHCGGFLGDAQAEDATPERLWVARTVGQMVAKAPQVNDEGRLPLIETVIERMAYGRMTQFASRYGFSKSGVSHWLNNGGLPNLKAWLTIGLHGGIGLDRLFAGEVEDWVMPIDPPQLSIDLGSSPRAGIVSRELDWEAIRAELRKMLLTLTPISISEAAQQLGVGRKHLYLRANAEARALAERHSRYRAAQGEQSRQKLQARIAEILDERLSDGYAGISARDVWEALDEDTRKAPHVFSHISEIMRSRLT